MSEADNPVTRLIGILKKAHEVAGRTSSQTANVGWPQVFDLSPNDQSLSGQMELISRLVETSKLVDEIENRLLSIEGLNHERYLLPFSTIKTLFSNLINLGNTQFNPRAITDTHMAVLGFCEDKLSEYHSEAVIEENLLKELLSDLNGLYEEVKASSITEELKALILDQLHIIRTAIHEYRIRGVTRLKEALERIVGMYVVNQSLIENESDTEPVSKFKAYLTKFSSAVTFAAKLTKLIESGAKIIGFLTPGGPTA